MVQKTSVNKKWEVSANGLLPRLGLHWSESKLKTSPAKEQRNLERLPDMSTRSSAQEKSRAVLAVLLRIIDHIKKQNETLLFDLISPVSRQFELQWMLIHCDPLRPRRETCHELPVRSTVSP